MRIVTWNVYRGELRSRAAELDALRPDLVVLQECGQPTEPNDDQCVWSGDRPIQGVGLLSRPPGRLEPHSPSPDAGNSAYPVRVVGPNMSLNVLAVWTKARPTYVQALLTALDAYRGFLTSGPAIVIGDFNSHWRFDKPGSKFTHAHLVEVLHREFGLVSAYHSHGAGRQPGEEEPTLYWRWKEADPFHVDYCFIPEGWVPQVRSVEIGGFAEWDGRSDHRPVLVELDETGLAGAG